MTTICRHCKREIIRDGTSFNYWIHTPTREVPQSLYGCPRKLSPNGTYAEPEKRKAGQP